MVRKEQITFVCFKDVFGQCISLILAKKAAYCHAILCNYNNLKYRFSLITKIEHQNLLISKNLKINPVVKFFSKEKS